MLAVCVCARRCRQLSVISPNDDDDDDDAIVSSGLKGGDGEAARQTLNNGVRTHRGVDASASGLYMYVVV